MPPVRALVAAALLALILVPAAGAAAIRGTARNDLISAADGRRDTIACLRGRDIVTADLDDRVAADCEVVSRRVSQDRTTTPGAQHRTEVEPGSAAYGTTLVSGFQVGRYSDGGAAAIGFATTKDAGRTWTSGLLPGVGRSSDPTVAYDATHGAWLAAVLSLPGGPAGPTGLIVSRSPDGLHWDAPVAATPSLPSGQFGTVYDKDWLTCDNGAASPFRGSCYLVYNDAVVGRLAAVTTHDGGLTWSAPATVTAPGLNGFAAQPVVRPDGAIVVLFLSGAALDATRSTDGGVSFDAPVTVSTTRDAFWFWPQQFRAPPLPSATVGPDGRAYVAWAGCDLRTLCDADDILVADSPDGVTWSPPRPATVSAAGHVLPALAADPATPGRLALVFYTGPGSTIDPFLETSTDGGTTWSAPQRLDTRPVRLDWLAVAGGAFLGDYVAVSFVQGRPLPVIPLAGPPRNGTLDEAIYVSTVR